MVFHDFSMDLMVLTRISMDLYGFIVFYEILYFSYGFICFNMYSYVFFMDSYAFLWIPMVFYGFL